MAFTETLNLFEQHLASLFTTSTQIHHDVDALKKYVKEGDYAHPPLFTGIPVVTYWLAKARKQWDNSSYQDTFEKLKSRYIEALVQYDDMRARMRDIRDAVEDCDIGVDVSSNDNNNNYDSNGILININTLSERVAYNAAFERINVRGGEIENLLIIIHVDLERILPKSLDFKIGVENRLVEPDFCH